MVMDGHYSSISHMNEKFEFYGILGIIVPSIMLMCFGVLCFPETAKALSISNYPEAFTVIALTAVALFLGNNRTRNCRETTRRAAAFFWGVFPTDGNREGADHPDRRPPIRPRLCEAQTVDGQISAGKVNPVDLSP